MCKIKLYLVKFNMKLAYEVIHIDESLENKGYKNDEYQLLIVSKDDFSSSDEYLRELRSTIFNCDYNKGLFLNFKKSSRNSIHKLHFPSNEERDIWYNRIINSLKEVDKWVNGY